MKISRFMQFVIVGILVVVNIVTFQVIHTYKDKEYKGQLRQAWIEGDLAKGAMRTHDIYNVPSNEEVSGVSLYSSSEVDPVCEDITEQTEVAAGLEEVEFPSSYEEGEYIPLKVTLKNTGKDSWYGDSHPCDYPRMRLGNADGLEVPHALWNDFNFVENGWLHNEFRNRVSMTEPEVKPGDKGTFRFWVQVPVGHVTQEAEFEKDEKTKEQKLKTIKRYKWAYDRYTLSPAVGEVVGDLEIPIVFKVGKAPEKEMAKLQYLNAKLRNYSLNDFSGEKNIYIRLSDQTGYMKFGDTPFHTYKVSSGAHSTPTPIGDHHVDHKSKFDERFGEPVRVGGASPHFRMPYWLGLNTFGKFTGYGLHEVPFLGESKEKSEFYQGGLHYDLGKNVSHGCVRSGPDDAKFVYEFAEVGMPVVVRSGKEPDSNDAVMASIRGMVAG